MAGHRIRSGWGRGYDLTSAVTHERVPQRLPRTPRYLVFSFIVPAAGGCVPPACGPLDAYGYAAWTAGMVP